MAIVFCDGFDHYPYANISDKWDGHVQTPMQTAARLDAAAGRFGTVGLVFYGNNDYLWKAIPSGPKSKLTMGVAFNPTNGIGGISHCCLISFMKDGYGQCGVGVTINHQIFTFAGWSGHSTTGGLIEITAYGTVPARSGVYQYIECQVDGISLTTGNIKVWLNGILIIDASNVRTAYSAAFSTIEAFAIGGRPASTGNEFDGPVYFDDVYVTDDDDTDGAGNTGNLGDVRIEEIMPNNDGYYKEWDVLTGTTHSDMVDDNPCDDDTTYVSTNTVGARDTYTYPSVTPTFGNVKAVCVNFIARKLDSGTSALAAIGRLDSVDALGSTITVGSSYAVYQSYMAKDPSGATWTIDNVKASEFGPKLVG